MLRLNRGTDHFFFKAQMGVDVARSLGRSAEKLHDIALATVGTRSPAPYDTIRGFLGHRIVNECKPNSPLQWIVRAHNLSSRYSSSGSTSLGAWVRQNRD